MPLRSMCDGPHPAGHCTQCSGGDTSHGSPTTLPATTIGVKAGSVTAWDSWTVSLTTGSRHRSPHPRRDNSLWPLFGAQLLCISLKLFQLPPPALAQSLTQSLDLWRKRSPEASHLAKDMSPQGVLQDLGWKPELRSVLPSSSLAEAGRWKVGYLWELLARSQAQLEWMVWATDIPKEC